MKKKWIAFMGTMALFMMFAGAAWSETVTLKYGTVEPPQAWAMINVVLPFLERVEKDSGGTLKIEKFSGGTLGRNPTKYTKQIKDGVIDIGYILNPYQPGRFPDDAVTNVPFIARDPYEATTAVNRMVAKGMLRGYEQLVPLGVFALNQGAIHTTFPVKNPGDLKGKKLRVAGALHHKMYEALGGTPVGLPIPKAAEAISKGVVEGIITEWNGLKTFRIMDLTRYHIMVPFGSMIISVLMNKEVYESLPAKAKAAFEKHLGEMAKDWGEKQTQNENQIMKAAVQDPRHHVYTPTTSEMAQWKSLMWPAVEAWEKEHPKGTELLKAYQSEIAKIRAQ